MTAGPRTKTGERASPVSAAFIEHESFLKRFLKRFLSRPQDIEDVVQDTYLKARCAEERQIISSPKAFLFRIARNEALKELRKKSRRITDYIEELDEPETLHGAASAEDEAIVKQRFGVFCQSVIDMTPKCRRVFLMCKVYGLSYKEIASQLGITVSGVEKHVARGLEICNANADRLEQSSPKKQAERQQGVENVAERNAEPGNAAVSPFDEVLRQKDVSR